jgi:cell filamentation protein, protein adenylyltransferase
MARVSGTYVTTTVAGENVRAFVPHPLPPSPPLALSTRLRDLASQAAVELGRLNVASRVVPSHEWFLYGFVRKEAVVTSQIEGTQATLVDLLAHEASNKETPPSLDVRDVTNYLDALAYARKQLASPKGLPLSLRLLKEAHKRLLRGSRGATKQPGEFRTSQNWVGGDRAGNAVFVPPPHTEMKACLDALEKYLHVKDGLPPLLRVGLIHVQFETIHPFLDGNGRLGRLLIALLLEHWLLLDAPLLYLSLHFKRHRAEYYDRLNAVRTEGDWEGWSQFFLEGVAAIAREATAASEQLFALVERDRRKVLDSKRASVAALRLLDRLPASPMITVARTVELLDTTKPTAMKALSTLTDLGVLKETTGRRRDRTFAYGAYLDRLREGTELEP